MPQKKLRAKIPQNNVTHTLEHTVDTSYQEPINLSQTPLNEDEISLMTKGPSFVLLPKNVDWLDTRIALDKFSSKLRWRYMRFKAEKNDPQTSEEPQNSEKTAEEIERTAPWTKNSKLRKPPSPTDNAALESFINCLETTILNPKNLRKVQDNMNKNERKAMKKIKKWDNRIVRLQDKGSRFIILDRLTYCEKISHNMTVGGSHKIVQNDLTKKHEKVVLKWAKYWFHEGEIDEHVYNFVTRSNNKPGNITGLVKAHKENYPFRVLTTGCGTAIENLSAFTEFFLGPLAQTHPAYIKDTTHFLNKIKDISENRVFPPGTLLVSWDVEAMFPNIDNNACLQAVYHALNKRKILHPSTECIVEAVKICLECNNSEFNDKHFVQIYGTAMGPKNSCSCADITMAVVDEVITTQGPFKPEHWCRFRDDCFDIWTQGQDALIIFTDFLNTIGQTLGWKTKLKFEVKFDEIKLDFLDTSLHLVDGRLEVDVFSKPTDAHLYLLPSSNQPPNITLNIPYGVGLRLKRICSESNRLDNRLEEYKTYFLNHGCDGKHIDQEFSKAKKLVEKKLSKNQLKGAQTESLLS